MTRRSPPLEFIGRPNVAPSDEHAQIALRGSAVFMTPIVRWLLRQGVSFGSFSESLKAVFVDVARHELERVGSKVTHSALSTLSGVHRKDVRLLAEPASTSAIVGGGYAATLSSQVFTMWQTNRAYSSRTGEPRTLPRSGPQGSFESLVAELSNDVHSRTVLEELMRLGLVRVDGETVVPIAVPINPSRRLGVLTAQFAASLADHSAAGIENLTAKGKNFLEESMITKGLDARAVDRLHKTARDSWEKVLKVLDLQATELVAVEGRSMQDHRVRIGVYFYSEPTIDRPTSEGGGSVPIPSKSSSKRTSQSRQADVKTDV